MDKQGYDVLRIIAEADKFNNWMYETISPFVKGNVLEIGSGIGNISAFLVRKAASLYLSDYSEAYVSHLKTAFSEERNIGGILLMDLTDPQFDEKFAPLFNTFDTVVALNVIEHIENDDLAILNCEKLLNAKGHLIILVPAYPALYNGFDAGLGHFRRYTLKQLKTLIARHLIVVQAQYFNFPGIFGWLLSGSILKKKTIPSSQMSIFNKLVPVFRIADKVMLNRAGLSVIIIGRKEYVN